MKIVPLEENEICQGMVPSPQAMTLQSQTVWPRGRFRRAASPYRLGSSTLQAELRIQRADLDDTARCDPSAGVHIGGNGYHASVARSTAASDVHDTPGVRWESFAKDAARLRPLTRDEGATWKKWVLPQRVSMDARILAEGWVSYKGLCYTQ